MNSNFVIVCCGYVSHTAFHAGRKSSVAKKPYNPILGETFQCFWDVPGVTSPDAVSIYQSSQKQLNADGRPHHLFWHFAFVVNNVFHSMNILLR